MTTPPPPYTDADLRAEAARQLANAQRDPDFVGISEQMEGTFIDSTIIDPDPLTGTEEITGTTWDELDDDQFDTAQRKVDDLIETAADVTEWAVYLGAEDLQPKDHRVITTEDGYTIAAFQIALDRHLELSPTALEAIEAVIRGDIADRD